MTPDKIKSLNQLLNDHEQTLAKRNQFDNIRDWASDTSFTLVTRRGWTDHSRGESEGFTISFSLAPDERNQVCAFLKTIYDQRLAIIEKRLKEEGCELTAPPCTPELAP